MHIINAEVKVITYPTMGLVERPEHFRTIYRTSVVKSMDKVS